VKNTRVLLYLAYDMNSLIYLGAANMSMYATSSRHLLLPSSAYKPRGLPAASQLANFHHVQCTLPAIFTSPHLIGAGMGGQFVHMPSSYVASRFIRKNGTTSSVPALVTVFLPQALKTAAACCASSELGAGANGSSAKEAIVVIS
jgi:hypothetical protein